MVHEMNRLETKHVEDVLDFVWRRFENQGDVTQYGEDWLPKVQTFYYNSGGHRKPNHDRPFFTFGFSSEYTHNGNECFGLLEDASLDFLNTTM